MTAMMVCGYYLAFFFMISHNYEGVFAQKDTTRPSNKGCEQNSWLYKQVGCLNIILDNTLICNL